MALKINIPANSWSEQPVTLNGEVYRFVFSFNQRDERWRLDIFLGSEVVVRGVKILPHQWLVSNPYSPTNFQHGDLVCIRMKNDNSPVGYDNLGFNKAYELVYYTNEEVLALGD